MKRGKSSPDHAPASRMGWGGGVGESAGKRFFYWWMVVTITGDFAVKQIIFEWKMVGLSLFDQYEMGPGTLLNQIQGRGGGK